MREETTVITSKIVKEQAPLLIDEGSETERIVDPALTEVEKMIIQATKVNPDDEIDMVKSTVNTPNKW